MINRSNFFMSNRVFISGLIVSLGLFIGRISGFFREMVIANEFGASKDSDLIVLLLTTPDLFVSLLMGGAMSMALIPEFKSIGPEKGLLLYRQITTWLMLLGGGLCGVLFFLKANLLSYLALGMKPEFIQQYSNTFFLSLLAIPFALSAGASLAYLNSQEKFKITSLGTLIVNTTAIIFLFISSFLEGEWIFIFIAIGVIVAAGLRWISQVIEAKAFPFSYLSSESSLISLSLIKRYCYALFTGGIIFALPIIMRTIASIEGEGTLSLINYATKLVELPLAVLITVFSVVFTPYLAEKFVGGNELVFKKTSAQVFFWVTCISLLVTLPLYQFPMLISQLLFGWGKLTYEQLVLISDYLSIFCISLPFQGVNSILIAIFSSRKDTLTPFLCTSILGFIFYAFVLAIKPDVTNLLLAVVTFYGLLFMCLLFTLKIKHDVSLITKINGNRFVTLFIILAVSIIVSNTGKDILLGAPLFFGVAVIGGYLIMVFTLMFFMYGRGDFSAK